MKFILSIFSFLLFVSVQAQINRNKISTFNPDELSSWLHVFASDDFKGRGTGEIGGQIASDFLAKKLSEFGYKMPLQYKYDGETEHSFFQDIPLMREKLIDVNITYNGKKLNNYKDVFVFRSKFNGIAESDELIFIGKGVNVGLEELIKSTDLSKKTIVIYDDSKGGTSNNNVYSVIKALENNQPSAILVLKQDFTPTASRIQKMSSSPGISINYNMVNVEAYTKYIESNFKGKEKAKPQHNPTMLAISGDVVEEEMMVDIVDEVFPNGVKPTKVEKRVVPVVYISEKAGLEMLGLKSRKFKKVLKKITKKGQFGFYTKKTKHKITVQKEVEEFSGRNVVAMIEGQDNTETLILSAHYDHLGEVNSVVYNGADDNGSGSIGLLAMASKFQEARKQGFKPKRNIMFVWFTGEEKGLLGSEYFAKYPNIPVHNIVTDLNIDMIGRIDPKHEKEKKEDYIYVIGADKLSKKLHTVNEEMNEQYAQIELDYTYNDEKDPNRYYYRSDHYNFAKQDIPVIFYFSGVHEDYHQSTDDPDKINYPKMAKILKLVFNTAWELSIMNERVPLDVKKK